MSFGVTPEGFKLKSLQEIKEEIETRLQGSFGQNFDLDPETPEGQLVGIRAEDEAKLWELAQDVYNSQYPNTSSDVSLDNVAEITGTVRDRKSKSFILDGVARGTSGTIVANGTVVSVLGDKTARFVVEGNYSIDIVDGGTFKSGPIKLVAEKAGPLQALSGTLTVIETPISGMAEFINESDAEVGSNDETDAELKASRNQELQLAGSSTVEAIIAEIGARPLVTAIIVFQNIYSIVDGDGRPPKSLDIVVQGDDEDDLAKAIWLVVGGGAETIGDIPKVVIDSQGFSQNVRFSRPTDISVYITANLIIDTNFYPVDGDAQVEQAFLDYGENQKVGQDVVVYGSKPLICAIENIPGITDIELFIGKTVSPTLSDNIIIEPREIAQFDSSRIVVGRI